MAATAGPRIAVGLTLPYWLLYAMIFTGINCSEDKAKEYAADSDTAVIWISRSPGEGNDRYAVKGDWYLSDEEEKALEYATKYFQNVVVFLNLPNMDMAWVDEYDVDAVLLYSEKDEITDVFMAVCALQEKGMSVSAQTSEDTELRYREKYVLRDGRPEMEAK